MRISSRTPEGFPSRCPICGAEFQIDFSEPGDDATCPVCGARLELAKIIADRLRRSVAAQLGVDVDQISGDLDFTRLGAESLDAVELVMFLEEEFLAFDVEIPAAEQIRTFDEAVQAVLKYRKRRGD